MIIQFLCPPGVVCPNRIRKFLMVYGEAFWDGFSASRDSFL